MSHMRRWVKICGVRSPEEAVGIAALGATAVGINLWPGSSRYVDEDAATEISRALARAWPNVERIGVTVNFASEASAYEALASGVGLTSVQLHGDEPMSLQDALLSQGLSVIRAFGLDAEAWSERKAVSAQIARCEEAGCRVLLDARVPGMYGGTGKLLDGELLSWFLSRHRLVVAGGLTPSNVQEIASSLRWSEGVNSYGALGLDVASGVEDEHGRKALGLVRRFLEAVNRA